MIVRKFLLSFLLLFGILLTNQINVFADNTYVNDETGYQVIIEDDAQLLSQEEQDDLSESMEKITKYGNVAFKTTDEYHYSTASFADNYCYSKFGTESSTVFVIDMNRRNVYIYSNGKIYKTINKSYANIITDNVYKYASREEYYQCADKAFSQIYKVLNGQKIAQPMKYISNALLAIIIALIINYFIARKLSSTKKANKEQLIQGMYSNCNIYNENIVFMNQTRKYSPRSKGGGGHGGGGGGGHGGGGGGHSF